MPQKGQIKHKWESLGMLVFKCKHCGTLKRLPIGIGLTEFKPFDKPDFKIEQPKCITRKKPEDETL